MITVLRAELLKLSTTRTALGFAVGLVVLVVAFVLISSLAGETTALESKQEIIALGGPLTALMLVFGVVGSSGDFRHRTLAAALLVLPDRGRLTLGRVLVHGLAAAAIGAAAAGLGMGIAALALSGADGPALAGDDYLRAWAGGTAALSLSAMIGVGIGVLVANQVVAVVGSLVYLLVLEPLVAVIDESAYQYTIAGGAAGLSGSPAENLPDVGAAFLILAGWTVLIAVVGVAVDRRREIR